VTSALGKPRDTFYWCEKTSETTEHTLPHSTGDHLVRTDFSYITSHVATAREPSERLVAVIMIENLIHSPAPAGEAKASISTAYAKFKMSGANRTDQRPGSVSVTFRRGSLPLPWSIDLPVFQHRVYHQIHPNPSSYNALR
jgi:hypothetical protein